MRALTNRGEEEAGPKTRKEPPTEDNPVSLRELKELAVRHLNASSPLRKLILSQPDELPRSVAMSKIPDFALLLEDEVRG